MKKILNISLILLIVLTLSGCTNSEDKGLFFKVNGEDTIYLLKGETYHDLGFVAKDEGIDISSYVTVNNLVNTSEAGSYIITYILDYEGKETVITRTVYVEYQNPSCTLIEGTNILECSESWSSYLNTLITIDIYFDRTTTLDSEVIFHNMLNIIAKYHMLSDKYNSYSGLVNLKTINDNPEETHQLSDELFTLISYSLENQKDLEDYFNIALGPVINIWHDYRENCLVNEICEVPDHQMLFSQKDYTLSKNIILDEENKTITMQENMSLDLGEITKGYISKMLIDYLNSLPLEGYLLNNGESNVSVGGTNPKRENGKFVIGITNPVDISSLYEVIVINDGDQIVTSGDYQQYYMVDDVLYHHIISNTTLVPESYCHSVSVVYSDPALADIYSTALFLMSIHDGLDFVNNIDGLEAIWYGIDGKTYYSENFKLLYLQPY